MTIEKDLPEAMMAAMEADAALVALTGLRIFPVALPADVVDRHDSAMPTSLVYYQSDRTDDEDLRGYLKPRVRYEFVAVAATNSAAVAVTKRIAGHPDSLFYPGANFTIGAFPVIRSELVSQRQRWNPDLACNEWRTTIELYIDLRNL